MGLHLYGIVSPAEMGQTPVRLVRHRDVAAAVRAAADDAPGPLRDAMAAHADVLHRLAASATVLPARFGIVFPDADTLLRSLLRPQYEALSTELRRLRNTVEAALRVTYHEEVILAEVLRAQPRLRAALTGRGRRPVLDDRISLGQRIAGAIQRMKEQDARQILARLAPLCRDAALEETGMDLAVLRGSFLLDRDRLGPFDRAVDALQAEGAPRLQVGCVGPLPPYSFVRVRLGAAPAEVS